MAVTRQPGGRAGKSHIAPLVGEMLQRIQQEVTRYERVITYWPSFGPSLEAAVCAALRTTTAAVSRQCGLIPMIGVSAFCHSPTSATHHAPPHLPTTCTSLYQHSNMHLPIQRASTLSVLTNACSRCLLSEDW